MTAGKMQRPSPSTLIAGPSPLLRLVSPQHCRKSAWMPQYIHPVMDNIFLSVAHHHVLAAADVCMHFPISVAFQPLV